MLNSVLVVTSADPTARKNDPFESAGYWDRPLRPSDHDGDGENDYRHATNGTKSCEGGEQNAPSVAPLLVECSARDCSLPSSSVVFSLLPPTCSVAAKAEPKEESSGEGPEFGPSRKPNPPSFMTTS